MLYRLRLQNRALLPYQDLKIAHREAEGLNLDVKRLPQLERGVHVLEFPLQFRFRGVYPLVIESLGVSDALGLLRRRYCPGSMAGAQVVVLPERIADFQLPLRRRGLTEDSPFPQDCKQDTAQESDLTRPYTPGDDLRQVHWKLSAKWGEMLVRNHSFGEAHTLRLFLDIRRIPEKGRERLEIEDCLIALALSAVDVCKRESISAQLDWGMGGHLANLPSVRDEAHFLRLLAELSFSEEAGGLHCFCHGILGRGKRFDLVVFLSVLDEGSFLSLVQICREGHTLLLYCVAPTAEEIGRLESLKNLGAKVETFLCVNEEVFSS